MACKLRATHFAVPHVVDLHSELLVAQSEHFKRPFGRWHNSSFTANLVENTKKLADAKISSQGILQQVRRQHGAAKFARVHFQAICLQMMMQNYFPVYDPVVRLRHKLQRWKLEGPPRLVAERALTNLNRLPKVARQKLVANALRAIFNGWVTERRMRTLTGSSESACALGCGLGSDCIEHYAFCHVFTDFRRSLRPHGVVLGRASLSQFLLVAKGMTDDDLPWGAIASYALANTLRLLTSGSKSDGRRNALSLLRWHAARGRGTHIGN